MTERPSKAQAHELVKNLIEGLGLEMNRTVRVVIEAGTITATVLKEERPKRQFPTEDRLFIHGTESK